MVLDKLQQFYKGKRGPLTEDDPYAVIRSILNDINPSWAGDRGPDGDAPPWGEGPYAKNPRGEGAIATDIFFDRVADMLVQESFSPSAIAKANAIIRGQLEKKDKKVKKSMDLTKDIEIKKISSDLARFLAAAAGWAMSDDTVRSGGGTPRGQVESNPEWERALRQQEIREEERRRKQEREEERRRNTAERRRAMRTRKSMDDYPEFNRVHNFWSKKSDGNQSIGNILELTKEVFAAILKDHAPVPPRQGLVWDEVKHRWVRPENRGHSVAEVQGGKRIRGVGTGVHERSVGGHGTGPARLTESGRRFRGVTDTGVMRPHERKHPATRRVKTTRSKGKGKTKRAGGYTRTG